MNVYERVEALLMNDRMVLAVLADLADLANKERTVLTLPGTFVVRNGDAEAALRKRLRKHGIPEPVTLVSIAHVPGLRVFIGRAHSEGDLVGVSVADMDGALKASPPSAPAVARLAALTVAKHAHKLIEKLAEA